MTATFRPQTHEHLVTSASALVAYLLRSDRDTRVVGYVEELALQPARDMLAALDAHRSAEGAVRSAFITYSEADDAADDALRQHFGHPKLNNKAAYDRLLTLTNGMTMNDYVRMTGPAQVSAVRDHLSRLSGAGHIPGIAPERTAAVATTNELLNDAWNACNAAEGAQIAASAALSAARVAFKGAYRSLIKQLEVYYSPEQIAEVLPRFDRPSPGGAPTEAEVPPPEPA